MMGWKCGKEIKMSRERYCRVILIHHYYDDSSVTDKTLNMYFKKQSGTWKYLALTSLIQTLAASSRLLK